MCSSDLWPSAIAAALLAASLLATLAPRGIERFALAHWTAIPRLAEFASSRLPGLLLAGAGRWAVLGGLLFLWARRRTRSATAAVFALIVADLVSVTGSIVTTAREEEIFSVPPAARAVARLNRGRLFGFTPVQDYLVPDRPADPLNAPFRMLADEKRGNLAGFTGAPFGVFYSFNVDYDLSDFFRVHLARRELLRTDGGAPGHLAAFSARAAILPRGVRWAAFSEPVGWLGPNWLVANPNALPTIRFAESVREVGDVSEAFALFRSETVDLSKVTIVETGRAWWGTLSGGRVSVLNVRPDRLELRTETAGPARLILARAYSPFREVRVDGATVPSDPTNICLTSIVLPAGSRRVELAEKLPGGAAGPALSVCGALVLAALAARRGLAQRARG